MLRLSISQAWERQFCAPKWPGYMKAQPRELKLPAPRGSRDLDGEALYLELRMKAQSRFVSLTQIIRIVYFLRVVERKEFIADRSLLGGVHNAPVSPKDRHYDSIFITSTESYTNNQYEGRFLTIIPSQPILLVSCHPDMSKPSHVTVSYHPSIGLTSATHHNTKHHQPTIRR